MVELLDKTGVLLAQGADNTGGPVTLIPMLAMGAFMFYFMIFRPQQQQEKKRKQMIDALKKNDRVLTTGGIYATVISVDSAQDKIVLKVDDDKGIKIAFTKSSVARVLEQAGEKSSETAS